MIDFLYFQFSDLNRLNSDTLDFCNILINRYNNNPDIQDLISEYDGELFPKIQSESPISGKIRLPTILLEQDASDFSYVMDNWLNLLSELKISLNCEKASVKIEHLEFPWSEEFDRFVIPT